MYKDGSFETLKINNYKNNVKPINISVNDMDKCEKTNKKPTKKRTVTKIIVMIGTIG